MGQVALGFRSLLYRLAVFFVLAMLLAWALGGTLWPRAEIVDHPGLEFGGQSWHVRQAVGGRIVGSRWSLVVVSGEGDEQIILGEATGGTPGLVLAGGSLHWGHRTETGGWGVATIESGGELSTLSVPDRLEVERQLERLRKGLGLQSREAIELQREAVLDPGAGSSDTP